jgi:DNA-binding NarL/FixJ family response regulator
VEDQLSIRGGRAFLIKQSPGFQCAAAWATGEEALRVIPETKPDVVLMDIGLPGMSGIDCIRLLKVRSPRTQIMMLTVFEDHDRIFKSLQAGATGYLLKKEPPDQLLKSIEDLHAGGSPMSNQIARRVVEEFQSPTDTAQTFESLSKREQEILTHLARGFLYKEIAANLGISLDTVRTHIRHIYEKLQVRSRTQAVNKAFPR